MRLILVINIPAAAGLALLAKPIIRLLFQRGAFSPADTTTMVPVLAAYALGLPFFSFVNLTLRAFYAQRDTATPVRAALLSFIVNVGLSFALMGPYGTVGLAIAGNLAIVAQAWFLQTRLIRRRPELTFGHLVKDLARIVAATMLMALALLAGEWLFGGWMATSWWGAAARLTVLIGAGVAVYAAGVWLMRVEGLDEIVAMVTKRFRGKTAVKTSP